MALDGGVPVLYAPAFAKMQVTPPSQIRNDCEFERAVHDASQFLDAWSTEAERLGGGPAAFFTVIALPRDTATLSDGQVSCRHTHARAPSALAYG